MSRERNNPGFTLIEMLVALTIIAAIMSMVYASYAATTRSIDASRMRTACVERGCFALRLMARQIRCAYMPAPRPSDFDPHLPEANPDAPMVIGVAALPENSSALFRGDSRDPRGEILSFVTSGGPGARGLQYLAYRFDKTVSTLSVSRQDGPGSLHGAVGRGDFNPVLRNVTEVTLGFYDGRTWERTWDLRRRQGLPRAVKIELTVTDEQGLPHHLETAVLILQTYSQPGGNRRTFAAQP